MPWRREEGGISRAAQAVRKGGRQRSSTAKKKSGSENSPHLWTQSPRPEMCPKEVVPVVPAKSRRVLLSFPLRGVRGSGPPGPHSAARCALRPAGCRPNGQQRLTVQCPTAATVPRPRVHVALSLLQERECEFGASHRGKWGKGSHFSREGGSGTGTQGLRLQKRTLHPRGGCALRQHSAWETGGTRTDLRTVVKHMLLILFLLEQGSTAFLTGSPGSSVHFHSSTSMNYPVQADIENTRFLLGWAW